MLKHVHRLWRRHPNTEGNLEDSRKKFEVMSKFGERKKLDT